MTDSDLPAGSGTVTAFPGTGDLEALGSVGSTFVAGSGLTLTASVPGDCLLDDFLRTIATDNENVDFGWGTANPGQEVPDGNPRKWGISGGGG